MPELTEFNRGSWKIWKDQMDEKVQQAMFEQGPATGRNAGVQSAASLFKKALTTAEEAASVRVHEDRAKQRRASMRPEGRRVMSEAAWLAAAMEENTSRFLQS
jgi:hypothetical protein